MVYQIGGHDAGKWDDYPSNMRMYYQMSFKGAYLTDFNEGFAAGKEDLEAETFTYFDELEEVEKHVRDAAWRAKIDGYIDATKSRGPTKYG